MPNVAVKRYEEPPMPPEQMQRLEKLAEIVQDMECGVVEDERERRYFEVKRRRDASSMRRRIQKEIRKSSYEVREREAEAADLRREVQSLEREEEAVISRKLRRDEKFEEGFSKVKSKEVEKNLLRLTKRTETESAHEKLAGLKASLRTLEQDQIRAITDAERGSRSRSSSRAVQLEFEVEELRRESDRLDEENEMLRLELESYKSSPSLREEKKDSGSKGAEARAVVRTVAENSEPNSHTIEAAPSLFEVFPQAAKKGVLSSPGRMAARQMERLDTSFGQQLGSSTASQGSFSVVAPPSAVRSHTVQASASAPVLPVASLPSSLPGSAVAPSSPPLRSPGPIELVARPAEMVAPSRYSTGGHESAVALSQTLTRGTSSLAASSRYSMDASQSSYPGLLTGSIVAPSHPTRLASSNPRLASPNSTFRSTSASSVAPAGTPSVVAPPRRFVSAVSALPSAPSLVPAMSGSIATVPSHSRPAPPRRASPTARSPVPMMGTRPAVAVPMQAAVAGTWWQQSFAPPVRA